MARKAMGHVDHVLDVREDRLRCAQFVVPERLNRALSSIEASLTPGVKPLARLQFPVPLLL
jgi:hypothetical protein